MENRIQNFALIGAAGYIAPRHMRAIKDCGHNLVCCVDPSDSVGIIDRFFPYSEFFTNFESFTHHLKHQSTPLDYISICSPNDLHYQHMDLALQHQAHAICEKPAVIDPAKIQTLLATQKQSQGSVNVILQLRLHPEILKLKKQLQQSQKRHQIDLTYITSRGNWYQKSWKGNEERSGGITTNIGIHFFDLLQWLFGATSSSLLHLYQSNKAAGFLQLDQADVRWFLSIDEKDLPAENTNQRVYRCLKIDDQLIDLSQGFTDLHTESYKEILQGKGLSLIHI